MKNHDLKELMFFYYCGTWSMCWCSIWSTLLHM